MTRLLHLGIRGFGQLRGEFSLEAGEGRAALLLEPNEAGKTTLVEAVLAALYGLPSDRRRAHNKLTELERFEPWDGGPYGLSLRLLHRGEELTIERDFRKGGARVLHAGTDRSDRYLQGKELRVGETLLGLSREQFLRSAFVRQGEVEWGDAGSLREALQRLAESTPGETTAAEAHAALEHALEQYEGAAVKRGKVETEIKNCGTRIQEIQDELEALGAERERMGRQAEELRRSDQRKAVRERHRWTLELAQRRIDLFESREKLAQAEKAREELEKLQALDRDDAALLELDPELLRRAEELRGRWQGAQKTAESYGRDAESSEAAAAAAEAARDALGLQRAPRGEDLEAIVETRARIGAAHQDRQRYGKARDEELAAIAELGFTVESATGMLAGMEYLTPEDRHLLENRTRDRFAVDEERSRLRLRLSELQQRQDQIERRGSGRRRLGELLVAAGAAVLVVGLLLGARWGLPAWLLPGVGALVLVGGLITRFGPGARPGAADHVVLDSAEGCAARIRELEEKNQELELAWQDLAHRLGIEAEELDERYRDLKMVERHLDSLQRIEERVHEVENLEEKALAELAPHWEPFADEIRVELFGERIEQLREAIEKYRLADDARGLARNQSREAEQKSRALTERVAQARKALSACGIATDEAESLDEGYRRLRELEERVAVARRRREEEIPSARARLRPDVELRDMRQRADQLAQQIRAAEEAGIESVELEGATPSARRDALESLRRELDREEREESTARERQLTEVRAFLKNYEEKAAPLMEELDQLRDARRRAVEFQGAVELARDTLAEISQESYRDWARELNRESGELLEALGTGSRRLEFNEELGFGVEHEGRPLTHTEVDQMLSAGARDGVYLAARMAVSRVLGAGDEALPLILDDPFAQCDDQRLLSGLGLLAATAHRQQVLLLACQHSRYDWALEQLGRPEEWVLLPLGTRVP